MATLTKKDLLDKSLYEKGQLECICCIHNSNCDELFDHCVANGILDGEVVHLKSKEAVKILKEDETTHK